MSGDDLQSTGYASQEMLPVGLTAKGWLIEQNAPVYRSTSLPPHDEQMVTRTLHGWGQVNCNVSRSRHCLPCGCTTSTGP